MARRDKPAGFIETKLNAPAVGDRFVSRRPLFQDFMASPDCNVLSVVAAAGSGKSTLLSELYQALVADQVPSCWLSLDAEDDSPASFATYLIAALGTLNLGRHPDTLNLPRANPARDFEPLFNDIVATISTLRAPAAIFLDDLQNIRDESLLRFLNKLLHRLPPCVKVAFASREIPLIDLAKLRVAGRLLEVQQGDLSFSASDTRTFLVQVHNLELDEHDLGALISTTEGWPTGLQLAALALRRHRGPPRDLIERFSGRDSDLTDYLMEAVLNGQPESVRNFLLKTSPLSRMSRELCEAASGDPRAGELLTQLSRSNLFVLSLDRQGGWYRYHHLFSDFLRHTLRRTNLSAYREICANAAAWCESSGLTTEAIQYALDGEHFDRACDLIAAHSPALAHMHGDHYTVLEWMRRLPKAYHERRPEILLSHAWSRAFSRDATLSKSLSERALALLDAPKGGWQLDESARAYHRLLARVIQMMAKGTEDAIDDSLSDGLDLRKRLNEQQPFLAASVCNTISYCHLTRRELEDSGRAAEDAARFGKLADMYYATVWADFLHGLVDIERGSLNSAEFHARRAKASTRAAGEAAHNYTVSMASLLSAAIAIQRCDYARAAEYVSRARTFSALFGPLEPLLLAIRCESRITAWKGDLERARRILTDSQDMAIGTHQKRLFINLAIEEARLMLDQGDLGAAVAIASRARLLDDDIAESGACLYQGEHEALGLLRIRLDLTHGKIDSALRQIMRMLHGLHVERRTSLEQSLRALKATALWKSQRHNEALRELDKALAVAAIERHAFPLALAGPDLLPVLHAIHDRRMETPDIAEMAARRTLETLLIATLSNDRSPSRATHTDAVEKALVFEPLTSREVELLRLVEAGLANRQLADTLLISEGTVKWHLHNIFSKIGVRNRTAAARRARELNLM